MNILRSLFLCGIASFLIVQSASAMDPVVLLEGKLKGKQSGQMLAKVKYTIIDKESKAVVSPPNSKSTTAGTFTCILKPGRQYEVTFRVGEVGSQVVTTLQLDTPPSKQYQQIEKEFELKEVADSSEVSNQGVTKIKSGGGVESSSGSRDSTNQRIQQRDPR